MTIQHQANLCNQFICFKCNAIGLYLFCGGCRCLFGCCDCSGGCFCHCLCGDDGCRGCCRCEFRGGRFMRILHFCNGFIIWFNIVLFSHFRCSQCNCKDSHNNNQNHNHHPKKPLSVRNGTGMDGLTALCIRCNRFPIRFR